MSKPLHSMIALGLVFSAAAVAAPIERRLQAMGTQLTFRVDAPADRRMDALRAIERAYLEIDAVEKRLSTWKPQSELSRVNSAKKGEAVSVSSELFDEISRAFACEKETGGAFSATLAPLMRLWEIRKGGGVLPSESKIAAAVADSRSSQFLLARGKVTRLSEAAGIEEGGFGKGYALDRAMRSLADFESAEIDFGGQVNVKSAVPIAVDFSNPVRRAQVLGTLRVTRGSISTSGDSERPGHILDPASGKPVPRWGSITVVAEDGLRADCLSTGLYVFAARNPVAESPRAAIREAARLGGIQAFALGLPDDKGRIEGWATCGLKEKLVSDNSLLDLKFDCSSLKKEKT